jgi:hypothetical protein
MKHPAEVRNWAKVRTGGRFQISGHRRWLGWFLSGFLAAQVTSFLDSSGGGAARIGYAVSSRG